MPTAREANFRAWDIDPDGADVATLVDLVRETSRDNCVDPRRVYVGGASMGAMMSSVLACSTELFAAAAPFAGVTTPEDGCRSGASLMAWHNRDDQVVRMDGSVTDAIVSIVPPWARERSRRAEVKRWAIGNGCRPDRVSRRVRADGIETRFVSCPDGVEVRFRIGNNGGHRIPDNYGPAAFAFFASERR